MSADVFQEGDTVVIEGLGTRTIGKAVTGNSEGWYSSAALGVLKRNFKYPPKAPRLYGDGG